MSFTSGRFGNSVLIKGKKRFAATGSYTYDSTKGVIEIYDIETQNLYNTIMSTHTFSTVNHLYRDLIFSGDIYGHIRVYDSANTYDDIPIIEYISSTDYGNINSASSADHDTIRPCIYN